MHVCTLELVRFFRQERYPLERSNGEGGEPVTSREAPVSVGDRDRDAQLTRISALAEPIRRQLYRFVAEQPDGVSRDQAAEGVGVPRHVAKFHLDKLAEDGLLTAEYRR